MKTAIVLLSVLFVGCSANPTQNSTVTFVCEKRINKDGDIRHKCSNKNIVAFRIKFK